MMEALRTEPVSVSIDRGKRLGPEPQSARTSPPDPVAMGVRIMPPTHYGASRSTLRRA